MSSLLTLLQLVATLLASLQGNAAVSVAAQQQVIAAATQVIASVQTQLATENGGIATAGSTINGTSTVSPVPAVSYTATTPAMSALASSYSENPTAIDYLGSYVGAGTVNLANQNCNQTLLNSASNPGGGQGYGPVYSGATQNPGQPSPQVACATINQNWVASFDYQNPAGTCFHADWTGTYQISCTTLQQITGSLPAVLAGGQVPTNGYATNVNWSAYNGRCYYTTGDVTGPYGFPAPAECGVNGNTSNPSQPSEASINAQTTAVANPYSTAPNPLGTISSAYVENPTAIDYLGSYVGAGTVNLANQNCNQTLLNSASNPGGGQGYGPVYSGATQNPGQPSPQVACATINQNWVASFDYQNPAGTCFHADWTGTYQISCTTLQQITGSLPAVLAGGQVPTNGYATNVNWSAYNGRCYYTTGDVTGPYGFPAPAECGVNGNTSNPSQPSEASINAQTTAVANPYSTAPNPLGTISSAYVENPTAIDYLGSYVGAGTVNLANQNCNQTLLNSASNPGGGQGYGPVYSGATQNPGQPSPQVACATINQNWVASFDYQNPAGTCFHADWTGTYQISCTTLQQITGSLPAVLAGGQVPTNGYATNVNWSAYNGRCYYTTGDVTGPYGFPAPAECGVNGNTSNPSQPSEASINAQTTAVANPYSTAPNPLGSVESAYDSNPTAVDYLGSYTGIGTVNTANQSCNTSLLNSASNPGGGQGYGSTYSSATINSGEPSPQVACATINKEWVGSMDYMQNNVCYHTDWTGTYSMSCTTLQQIDGMTLIALPNNTLPTNSGDPSVPWKSYRATCYYTTGDVTGPYGFPSPIICGGVSGE